MNVKTLWNPKELARKQKHQRSKRGQVVNETNLNPGVMPGETMNHPRMQVQPHFMVPLFSSGNVLTLPLSLFLKLALVFGFFWQKKNFEDKFPHSYFAQHSKWKCWRRQQSRSKSEEKKDEAQRPKEKEKWTRNRTEDWHGIRACASSSWRKRRKWPWGKTIVPEFTFQRFRNEFKQVRDSTT